MIRLFWLMGLFSLIATIYLSNIYWIILLLIYYYLIGIFGLSIGYHRYFSHRSFETGYKRKLLLLFLNLLTGQGTIVSQVSIHRHHHKFSDTDKDVHGSNLSFFNRFFFSLKSNSYFLNEKKVRPSIDLIRDETVLFFHRHYFKIWVCVLVIATLINWDLTFSIILPGVGLTFLHTNFVRSAISHKKLKDSYRNFETDDTSFNTMKYQWFSLSEGLHNNHHQFPNRYDHSIKSGEFDPAGWIIKRWLLVDKTQK
jgi:fatty-acid desaturase